MCGICGKVRFDGKGIERSLIERMCRAVAHRGPDDRGMYVEAREETSVGLGHQRLSVIDLSKAGHQPMCNEEGTVWIVFNGEIYNFGELRAGLERQGHRFSSSTDTEVLVHLYEEQGIHAVRLLNGMFAFALWDRARRRLFLCRDRIGIKPLVYWERGGTVAFASEIKSLLCDPEVDREISMEALELYLTFNYVPAPWTMFEGIRKLEPGHYLLAERGRVLAQSYWDLTPRSEGGTEGAPHKGEEVPFYKERLFEMLDQAVEQRLIADVPLGAFLSGGIDSSIIVGLMARHSARPVATFSIGYRDQVLFDETPYAREVAAFNRTDHHEFKLTHEDIVGVFVDVLSAFDEPFADSSAVPTYLVSKVSREQVTVALSGDGADELFAGYRLYSGEYWRRFYRRIPRLVRRGVIEPVVRGLPDSRGTRWLEYARRLKKFVEGADETLPRRVLAWTGIFSEAQQMRLLRDRKPLSLGEKLLEERLVAFDGDELNRMLYADIKGSLPCDMLTKVDWMSMQHALEVRVPFLDHRVVELAFRMSSDLKLHGGRRKYILLETFKPILPKCLHRRPKWGFEMPIGEWLRGDLHFLLEEYLSPARIEAQGLFVYREIKRLKDHLLNYRSDTSWHLWNLIVFQFWYDTFLA